MTNNSPSQTTTNELSGALLLGAPIYFKKLFQIYPPTLKQVVTTENFSKMRQILTYSQENIEDIFTGTINGDYHPYNGELPTPFTFMLANAYQSKEYEQLVKDAFKLFIHADITPLYANKTILIGNIEEVVKTAKTAEDMILLKEEDFFEFQNYIRICCGESEVKPYNANEHPKIKQMKAKARYRDYIKAKNSKGQNLNTLITAICCMGIGLNPLNIGEVSYAVIQPLISTYQAKEKYEIDMNYIYAGANPKKVKPEYWIK